MQDQADIGAVAGLNWFWDRNSITEQEREREGENSGQSKMVDNANDRTKER